MDDGRQTHCDPRHLLAGLGSRLGDSEWLTLASCKCQWSQDAGQVAVGAGNRGIRLRIRRCLAHFSKRTFRGSVLGITSMRNEVVDVSEAVLRSFHLTHLHMGSNKDASRSFGRRARTLASCPESAALAARRCRHAHKTRQVVGSTRKQ